MDRRTVESALLAALALFAVAAAAATLPTAVPGGSGPGGSIFGSGEGGGLLPTPPQEENPPAALELPFLRELVILMVVILLVAMTVFAFLYRRDALETALGTLLFLGLIAALVWLASFIDPIPLGPSAGDASTSADGVGGSDDGQLTPPPIVTVLLLAALLVGAAVVLLRSGPAAGSSAPEEAEAHVDDTVAAVGRSAGRAADRIEERGDLDNEVYRAWREMTGLLEVPNPESSTPGEFAAAAVDARMAPDDVAELTRLFEDVRYGGEEPTASEERRALAILRHVEETYVPGEGETE